MKKKIIHKILQESKDTKKIIGFRNYNEDDDFWCGYVKDFNEESVIIQHFTKFGKLDGFIYERLDNIESIETDDDYAKSFQYLLDNVNEIEKQEEINLKVPEGEEWQYDLINQLSKDNDRMLTLEINNDILISGFIKEFDDTYIILHCVNDLGQDEGFVSHELLNITSIYFDRKEDRKRKLFYEWKLKDNR